MVFFSAELKRALTLGVLTPLKEEKRRTQRDGLYVYDVCVCVCNVLAATSSKEFARDAYMGENTAP